MLPFILLPIGIANKNDQKVVTARIQPDQIDYYYPGFNTGTVIVNKSGNSFLTSLEVQEVDSVLLNYHAVSKAGKGKFGILEIKAN